MFGCSLCGNSWDGGSSGDAPDTLPALPAGRMQALGWLSRSLPAGRKHPRTQGYPWSLQGSPMAVSHQHQERRSVLGHEKRSSAGISHPGAEIPGLGFHCEPPSATSASCPSTGKQPPARVCSLGTSGDTPSIPGSQDKEESSQGRETTLLSAVW